MKLVGKTAGRVGIGAGFAFAAPFVGQHQIGGENSFESIREAVKANRSLAVLRNEGQFPVLTGDFRLVKYGTFLMDEYFPRYTELCRIEGDLMMEQLRGNAAAAEALKVLGTPAGEFRKMFFSRG